MEKERKLTALRMNEMSSSILVQATRLYHLMVSGVGEEWSWKVCVEKVIISVTRGPSYPKPWLRKYLWNEWEGSICNMSKRLLFCRSNGSLHLIINVSYQHQT